MDGLSDIEEALRNLLDGLPDNADDIAKFLADRGVRGVPGMMCACPLARWIREELEVPAAAVDDAWIAVSSRDGQRFRASAKPVVAEFIDAFDNDDQYPFLVDEGGQTAEEMWASDSDWQWMYPYYEPHDDYYDDEDLEPFDLKEDDGDSDAGTANGD